MHAGHDDVLPEGTNEGHGQDRANTAQASKAQDEVTDELTEPGAQGCDEAQGDGQHDENSQEGNKDVLEDFGDDSFHAFVDVAHDPAGEQDGENGAGIGQTGNREAEHHQALVQGCKGGVDEDGTKEHAEQSADFEVGRRGIAGVDGQEVESCICDETEQDIKVAVSVYPAKDIRAEDRQKCLEHGGADQHRDQRYE